MTMELASTEGRPCPSDFTLDRLLHGELAALPAEVLRAHLRQCHACAGRLEGLAASGPTLDLDRLWREGGGAPARPRPRLWPARMSALAAVAVAAAVLVWRAERPPTILLKGSPWTLTVIARTHDGAIKRVAPGAALRRGDQLRFEVATSWPRGQVAIVSADARGQVSRLFPDGEAMVEVAGGARTLLDGAVELDDSVGAERIILVGCRRSIPMSTIVDAARVALARASGDPRGLAGLGLGCHEETFWLDKVAR